MLYLWIKSHRDYCHYFHRGKYRGAAHSICNVKFDVSNEISVVFHRSSNYDDYVIIKKLANEFEGEFECLGENKEQWKKNNYATIKKKVTKIDKDVNEIVETRSYKIIAFDILRFMASSIWNIVNNLTEGIH